MAWDGRKKEERRLLSYVQQFLPVRVAGVDGVGKEIHSLNTLEMGREEARPDRRTRAVGDASAGGLSTVILTRGR